jgi:VanZ family protein
MLRWAWIGYWAAIFVLTHLPKMPGVRPAIPHLDKAVHAGLFFGLTVLGGLAMGLRGRPDRVRAVLLWAVVYAVYGAVDEWLQGFVRRDPDVLDWLADLVGITAGSTVLLVGAGMRKSDTACAARTPSV